MNPDPAHIDEWDAEARRAHEWGTVHDKPERIVVLVAEVRRLREQLTDAAMLDALTRHGVLTEERTEFGGMLADARRLVTQWEVAP